MDINYNHIRHLELFSRSQNLEKQGKYLYKENQEEYLELLNYRAIFWKNKRQFVLLMEKNSALLYRKTLDV